MTQAVMGAGGPVGPLDDRFLEWWFAPWRLPHAPSDWPGLAPGDLQIQLENDVLTVSGEADGDTETQQDPGPSGADVTAGR